MHEVDIPLYWTEHQLYTRLYPSYIYNETLLYIDKVNRFYNFTRNIDIIYNFFNKDDGENVLNENTYKW